VTFCSANIVEFTALSVDEAIGRDLSDVIGAQAAHQVGNAAARAGAGHIAGVVLRAELGSGLPLADITVHRYQDRVIVELEPSASPEDTEVALHLTQSLVRRTEKETELEPLVKSVARLVRAMLGYNRVMVYRFLHNGAGRVIAEAKDNQLDSFLGQHFPFSDIPVQARRLYTQNWIRVISDVAFTPVPLMPLIGDNEPAIDLSHAHLRSVSPIHCEYLRNIGVEASMSISIVVDGELWGLIACHHNSPKALSIPLRLSAELFAQYFSLHVASIEHRAARRAAATTRVKLDAIVAGIKAKDSVHATLSKKLREFSSLLDCDGAAVWYDGEWAATGVAPERKDVPQLMELLTFKANSKIWDTQDLRGELPDSDAYGGRVAGVMAIPVSASGGDYLMFFRSEEAHEITWAGEPVKTAISTPNGIRLSPRGSFEAWREDVQHKSLPWTEEDLSIADAVRGYLREVLLHHNDATEAQRERRESQRSLLNAELNHRVKNILALVKSIAVQTGTNAATVEDYARSFEGRLRALSYAHDQSFEGKDGGELKALIDAEASMHRFSQAPDRIKLSGPPVGLSERAFGVFALLLHEMMTNAAKYGSLSVPAGRLDVVWELDAAGACLITWRESGGPAVTAPTRKGFGSTLIEKTISFDLGGSVKLRFDREGLNARFVVPAEHLREVTGQEEPATLELSAVRPLDGLSILLVEDQALIAMDTEEILKAMGAAKVMVTPNVSAALEYLAEVVPDCAVLDLNLGEETSEPVAEALSERAIPYVFATGYRDSVWIPAGFADVPVVRKPISYEVLAQILSQVMSEAGSARPS